MEPSGFLPDYDGAEWKAILGGKQTGGLRKYRQAREGLSIRPPKIAWNEGTPMGPIVGQGFWVLFAEKSSSPRPATRAYEKRNENFSKVFFKHLGKEMRVQNRLGVRGEQQKLKQRNKAQEPPHA